VPETLLVMLTQASNRFWRSPALNCAVARLFMERGMAERARPLVERTLQLEVREESDKLWLAQAAQKLNLPVPEGVKQSKMEK